MDMQIVDDQEKQAIADVIAHQVVCRRSGAIPSMLSMVLYVREEREVFRVRGDARSIVAAAEGMQGVAIVSTHPNQGSFGLEDWRLMYRSPSIGQIISANGRSSVFRGNLIEGRRADLDQILTPKGVPVEGIEEEIAQAVFGPMYDRIACSPQCGGATSNPTALEQEMRWMWSHLICERLSYLGYVAYEATLANEDDDALNNPAIVEVLLTGRGEIARRIPC